LLDDGLTDRACCIVEISITGSRHRVAPEEREIMKICGIVLLAASLVAASPGAAQTAARSAGPIRLAASSSRADDYAGIVRTAQFMPGMPGMGNMQAMPGMPGMGTPGTSSGMGGMTMMMTGEGVLEMMAGACTAGLLVGALGATAASTPLMATGVGAPVSAVAVLSSAGVGCGIAMVATLAGIGGMLAWRTGAEALQ
jgi:hypothetical protein